MNISRRNIITSVICKALMALQMITLCACGSLIYDDLDPCDEGLRLRFVYDYNMEFANAFPSQVDCLTLLVYDESGNYICTRTETVKDLLSDENWRMVLDLPAGNYKLLAYGGMACDEASFAFGQTPSVQMNRNEMEVYLKPQLITRPTGTKLHDHFYGALEVNVPVNAGGYTEATVKMMKNTNNVRVVLQHMDGSTVDNSDFIFEITGDNTRFNHANAIIPTTTTTYCPWARGQAVAGTDIDTGDKVEVAYAEISTSRFMTDGGCRLTITRTDGTEVLSIPLIDYLLLLKSQEFATMKSQEFLDRESRWNLLFFLDRNNHWIQTQIVINGWVVRINDFEA